MTDPIGDDGLATWWPDPKVRQALEDLKSIAATLGRLAARGRAAFDTDETLPLAAEALLTRLGEAASRLPDDFRLAFPETRWRAVRGMRNLLTHQYEIINPDLVWEVICHDVPELVRSLGLDRVRSDGRDDISR